MSGSRISAASNLSCAKPCDIEYVDVAEHDLARLDPLGADRFVVLGGPIGVNDHATYRVATQEIELLETRLAADRPESRAKNRLRGMPKTVHTDSPGQFSAESPRL
ncbi:hypothetical protein [Rhizobium sp. 9140]|uniref:hypothetical protein n=1 Tax=Rhizobium sp. 9140 TaxID=1761900 RepID=UPI000A47F98C|nr:hypothetical protein [Rhizobium sp. 9140]